MATYAPSTESKPIIEKPGRLISILHRQMLVHISHGLKPLGLSTSQYLYLMALYAKDGSSQEEVSEYVGVDKSATKRAVDLLVEEGYVRRVKNLEDRRAYHLYLTQKALDVQPGIRSLLDRMESLLLKGFTESQKTNAINLLNRMAANVLSEPKSGKDRAPWNMK